MQVKLPWLCHRLYYTKSKAKQLLHFEISIGKTFVVLSKICQHCTSFLLCNFIIYGTVAIVYFVMVGHTVHDKTFMAFANYQKVPVFILIYNKLMC